MRAVGNPYRGQNAKSGCFSRKQSVLVSWGVVASTPYAVGVGAATGRCQTIFGRGGLIIPQWA